MRTPEERFWDKVMPEPNSGCWLWTGAINGEGYGALTRGGRCQAAHRYSYEMHKGEIPSGKHLDHLCRVRSCVNPDHLEPVTIRENLLRGVGIVGTNARKTHCPAGHEYSIDNLSPAKLRRGHRRCLACDRERQRRKRDAA